MHEFNLIKKYFLNLSKHNKGSLNLNDDVFFDKSRKLVISIDSYLQGTHFIDFKKPDLVIKKLYAHLFLILSAKVLLQNIILFPDQEIKSLFQKKI